MKKFLKLFLCLTLVITVTGCSIGSSDDSKDEPKTEEKKEEKENEGNNTQTDSSSKELKDFVETAKSSVQAYSNSTLKADLIARDNSLVYVYTYTTTYNATQTATMKTKLEEGINGQKDTFEKVLSQVKTVAPSTKSVIIEYYNGDNTLIAKIEIK